MRIVIDSSVAVKWFVTEDLSEQALAAVRHEMMAPQLLIAECANVFWKKCRRREILPQRATLAMGALARSSVRLHPLPPLSASALETSILLDHAAYDCFYLALASREGVPFLTADAKLKQKVSERMDANAPEIILLADFSEFSS